jgi:hypothetical protein
LGGDIVVGFLHFRLEGLQVACLGEGVNSPPWHNDGDALALSEFSEHAHVAKAFITEEPVGAGDHNAPDHIIGDVHVEPREFWALIVAFGAADA